MKPRVTITPRAKQLATFVSSEFAPLANPDDAAIMQRYMKADMPFHGIKKPQRVPIYRLMKKQFAPDSPREYRAAIMALWRLPHREEKYAAAEYAKMFPQFITIEALDVFEYIIRDGAWWDLIDIPAVHLVGHVLRHERRATKPIMNQWIRDDDMWIRRAALLAHNRHREDTDEKQLFAHCRRLMPETEFFIRKAVGWALREYSYARPERVADFIDTHRSELSGLSIREGSKQLNRLSRPH